MSMKDLCCRASHSVGPSQARDPSDEKGGAIRPCWRKRVEKERNGIVRYKVVLYAHASVVDRPVHVPTSRASQKTERRTIWTPIVGVYDVEPGYGGKSGLAQAMLERVRLLRERIMRERKATEEGYTATIPEYWGFPEFLETVAYETYWDRSQGAAKSPHNHGLIAYCGNRHIF